MDITVSWEAGDALFNLATCDGFFGLLQDKLSEEISGKLEGPGGSSRIAQTDDSVTFRQFQDIDIPSAHPFTIATDDVHVDGAGLRLSGTITPRLDVSATWNFTPSRWVTEGDCHTRTLRRTRRPAQVSVVGAHPHRQIVPLADPDVPKHAFINNPGWRVSIVRYSQPGAVPVAFDVFYDLPASIREGDPVGAPFVVLYTNAGVRRIELTVVSVGQSPAAMSDAENIAAMVALISKCMAISDQWGMGVLNLDWLVDPPDLDLGRAPLREWTISAAEVAGVADVELVAIDTAHSERVVGRLAVEQGKVFGRGGRRRHPAVSSLVVHDVLDRRQAYA